MILRREVSLLSFKVKYVFCRGGRGGGVLVTIQITSNYTEQRTLALRPARLPPRALMMMALAAAAAVCV